MQSKNRYLLPAILLVSSQAFSQSDSVFNASQADTQLLDQYAKITGTKQLYLNGPEYYYDDSRLSTHVFYPSPSFQENSSIIYDGVTYHNLPLTFDILRQEVVTLSPDRSFRMRLLPEKLSGFTMGNDRFVRISNAKSFALPFVYCQVVYEGKISLLVYRVKRIAEVTGRTAVEYNVFQETGLYLLVQDMYVPVRDNSDLLNALPNHRAAVSSFIEQQAINVRNEGEAAIVRVLRFYDQTTDQ